MTGAEGRLLHSWRGRAAHAALLDDYADLSRAALALHEATGEAAYLDQTRAWLAILERHYADPAGPGYFFSADDADDLIARVKTASDLAVPSGNGTLVGVLARLFYLTGESEWRERAERLVAAFSGEIARNFFPLATLLNGNDLLLRARQIVVIGPRGEAATDALAAAAHRSNALNAIVSVFPTGHRLAEPHPAAGKGAVDGKPTAYLCIGPVCSPPLTDPASLAQELSRRG
jgi:uncharacterized protein YyaL (SSP411 family)